MGIERLRRKSQKSKKEKKNRWKEEAFRCCSGN